MKQQIEREERAWLEEQGTAEVMEHTIYPVGSTHALLVLLCKTTKTIHL